MAKYTCEVDTEAKTGKFSIDGKEVNVDSVSVSFYDSMSYDGSGTDRRCCCVSYTESDGAGDVAMNHSIIFDTIDEQDSMMASLDLNLAPDKIIKRAISNILVSNKLSKALSRKV
jgi:hypothetical protein